MLKLYLVCLSYLLLVTDVVRCKPDYYYNAQAGGWLKLHLIPATWEEAFLRCHYEGAVLASPLNNQLANALNFQMTPLRYPRIFFLGIHDLFSNGDFVSVEGVKLPELDIEMKEFERKTGDCLNMRSINDNDYQINRIACDEPLPYICYRKFDNETMNECGTFDNEYNLDQRTGSCYKVHTEEQTWSNAYRICAAEGGYLVILDDGEEARIIEDMFPVPDSIVDEREQFHIGLLAWGKDRTWVTIHGDRIEDVFHVWYPGQPQADNYGGHLDPDCHAVFLRAGKLATSSPNTSAKFVCEKSPDFIRLEPYMPQ